MERNRLGAFANKYHASAWAWRIGPRTWSMGQGTWSMGHVHGHQAWGMCMDMYMGSGEWGMCMCMGKGIDDITWWMWKHDNGLLDRHG